MVTISLKKLFFISTILSFLILPSNILWIEIGEIGKEYYGINVPNIYILGTTIIGKDRNFWGINLAYKFQLVVIIYLFITNLYLCLKYSNFVLDKILIRINFILLVLFPVWLNLYLDGVLNNSDGIGCDIKIHFGFGLYLYFCLILINIIIFLRSLNSLTSTSIERNERCLFGIRKSDKRVK